MINPKAIQNLLVTSRNHSQSTQMNQVSTKVMNYDTNIWVTLTDIRLSMSISWMHRKTTPDSPSPSMSMSSCLHTTLHSLRRNEHIQMFSIECFTLQSQHLMTLEALNSSEAITKKNWYWILCGHGPSSEVERHTQPGSQPNVISLPSYSSGPIYRIGYIKLKLVTHGQKSILLFAAPAPTLESLKLLVVVGSESNLSVVQEVGR